MNASLQVAEDTDYKMCFVQCPSSSVPEEQDYAFVLVPADKIQELQQAIKSMQPYDLAKYGVVVENGIGTPPKAVIDRMKREFDFELSA